MYYRILKNYNNIPTIVTISIETASGQTTNAAITDILGHKRFNSHFQNSKNNMRISFTYIKMFLNKYKKDY